MTLEKKDVSCERIHMGCQEEERRVCSVEPGELAHVPPLLCKHTQRRPQDPHPPERSTCPPSAQMVLPVSDLHGNIPTQTHLSCLCRSLSPRCHLEEGSHAGSTDSRNSVMSVTVPSDRMFHCDLEWQFLQ